MKVNVEIPACVQGTRSVELDTKNLDDLQKLIGEYMGKGMEIYFEEYRRNLRMYLKSTAYDIRRMAADPDPEYMEAMALYCQQKEGAS